MASHSFAMRTNRATLRLSRRAWLTVAAAAVVVALVAAMALQAVPVLTGGGSSQGSASGANSTFAQQYRDLMRGYVAASARLEQSGRATASSSTDLINVYRNLEHETNSVLLRAQALKPVGLTAAAFANVTAVLAAEDRHLRAVVAAGDSNDMAAVRAGIESLVNDLQALGSANSAVERALKS